MARCVAIVSSHDENAAVESLIESPQTRTSNEDQKEAADGILRAFSTISATIAAEQHDGGDKELGDALVTHLRSVGDLEVFAKSVSSIWSSTRGAKRHLWLSKLFTSLVTTMRKYAPCEATKGRSSPWKSASKKKRASQKKRFPKGRGAGPTLAQCPNFASTGCSAKEYYTQYLVTEFKKQLGESHCAELFTSKATSFDSKSRKEREMYFDEWLKSRADMVAKVAMLRKQLSHISIFFLELENHKGNTNKSRPQSRGEHLKGDKGVPCHNKSNKLVPDALSSTQKRRKTNEKLQAFCAQPQCPSAKRAIRFLERGGRDYQDLSRDKDNRIKLKFSTGPNAISTIQEMKRTLMRYELRLHKTTTFNGFKCGDLSYGDYQGFVCTKKKKGSSTVCQGLHREFKAISCKFPDLIKSIKYQAEARDTVKARGSYGGMPEHIQKMRSRAYRGSSMRSRAHRGISGGGRRLLTRYGSRKTRGRRSRCRSSRGRRGGYRSMASMSEKERKDLHKKNRVVRMKYKNCRKMEKLEIEKERRDLHKKKRAIRMKDKNSRKMAFYLESQEIMDHDTPAMISNPNPNPDPDPNPKIQGEDG